MNALDCTTAIAEPLGTLGASFYFSPQAIAIGETIELDVVTFYAAGRGGVLGDIDVIEVDEVFFFFKDGMVASIMEKARAFRPDAGQLWMATDPCRFPREVLRPPISSQ